MIQLRDYQQDLIDWARYFDYQDGVLIWKSRSLDEFKTERAWSATNSNFAGKQAGAVVSSPRSATKYRQLELFGKAYKCHRVVWEMHHGEIPAGLVVDHINGDGLDNRIENLRLVDAVDSAHNLPMQKSNTTGIVGVNWHKSAKAWQARIAVAGKRIDLGRFDCLLDAVAARKRAEVEHGYHKNHGRTA